MKKYKALYPLLELVNEKFQRVLIIIVTFIILFLISSISIIPKKYDLEVGSIAPQDIKAPRDFTDEASTKAKLDLALSNVKPQYNRNPEIYRNAINKLNEFILKVEEVKKTNADSQEKIEKLKTVSLINLSRDDYSSFLSLKDNDLKELSEFLKGALDKIYSMEIKNDNEEDLKKAQENLNFYIRNSNMGKTLKELSASLGFNLIKPNYFYDSERTEELKNIVKKQVEPVIIKKNQNIVLKGEAITEEHINLMKSAGLLHKNIKGDVLIFLGIALLIMLTLILIAVFLNKMRGSIFKRNSNLILLSLIVCINTGLSAVMNTVSPFLIPSAFIVILLCIIFDPLTAFIVSIPSAIPVACVTNFNLEIMLLYITGCVAGILFTYNKIQRSNVILEGISVGLINAAAFAGIGFINNMDFLKSLINFSCVLLSGFLSSIFAIGILPVFEQIFDIITPLRLLELSNPNHPLLKKLLFEAPGTYHHSILVGNLAEAAADEIGASTLLSRVGAYYHDVGKTKRPYFFKENQITNDNPHDKITPKLSAMIITSHVKDGLELAKEHNLPRAIRDIILQHHGTTLVKYFYVMAVNEGSNEINEETFRYDGPKPESKEAAIVMLADSAEAAVRSLSNPMPVDIEKMIERIIKDKFDDGQLDNCDLTLRDIDKIKAAFIKALSGVTHNRVEYPELKDGSTEKEEENAGN